MKRAINKILSTSLLFSACNNENPRKTLINDIKYAGFPKREIAIEFARFFEGNDDIGSIAPNIEPVLSPELIYKELKNIKSDSRTIDIFVRITDLEDESWPYSDAIYVVGNWTIQELQDVTQKIQPDEIIEGWLYEKPTNVSTGEAKIFTLWWD